MGWRIQKQIIIAVCFFFIMAGLAYGLVKAIVPQRPPATPNPTVNLLPIKITGLRLFPVGNNDYDLFATISNPNHDYGAAVIDYKLTFLRSDKTIIRQMSQTTYILPDQTKPIIITPLQFQESVATVSVVVDKVLWQKLDPVAANGVNISIRQLGDFVASQKPGLFGKIGGTLFNDTDLDFDKVDVNVLVKDQTNQIIAVNKTTLSTFLSKTTRGFEVAWFQSFQGQPVHVEAYIDTNLFENANFLNAPPNGLNFAPGVFIKGITAPQMP